MTIMMVLSIVCLAGGVYGAMPKSDTEVHIRVYAPSGFIHNGSEVYFNKDQDMRIEKKTKYHLNVVEFGE